MDRIWKICTIVGVTCILIIAALVIFLSVFGIAKSQSSPHIWEIIDNQDAKILQSIPNTTKGEQLISRDDNVSAFYVKSVNNDDTVYDVFTSINEGYESMGKHFKNGNVFFSLYGDECIFIHSVDKKWNFYSQHKTYNKTIDIDANGVFSSCHLFGWIEDTIYKVNDDSTIQQVNIIGRTSVSVINIIMHHSKSQAIIQCKNELLKVEFTDNPLHWNILYSFPVTECNLIACYDLKTVAIDCGDHMKILSENLIYKDKFSKLLGTDLHFVYDGRSMYSIHKKKIKIYKLIECVITSEYSISLPEEIKSVLFSKKNDIVAIGTNDIFKLRVS
jgi:hypothetical protein